MSAAPADDEQFMRRALALATRGAGQVAPNPLVGARCCAERADCRRRMARSVWCGTCRSLRRYETPVMHREGRRCTSHSNRAITTGRHRLAPTRLSLRAFRGWCAQPQIRIRSPAAGPSDCVPRASMSRSGFASSEALDLNAPFFWAQRHNHARSAAAVDHAQARDLHRWGHRRCLARARLAHGPRRAPCGPSAARGCWTRSAIGIGTAVADDPLLTVA